MPTTLTSTGITFPDGTSQSAAAEGGGGFARKGAVTHTSSGTYTKPADLGYLYVAAIGGGGGASREGSGMGGGGAGGATAAFWASDVPSSISYNVGTGGICVGSNQAGNAGNASNFHNVTANGGSGNVPNTYNYSQGVAGGNGAVNGSYVYKFEHAGGRGSRFHTNPNSGQSVNNYAGGGGGRFTAPPTSTNQTSHVGGYGGYDQTYKTFQAGNGGSGGQGATGGGGYNPGLGYPRNQSNTNQYRSNGGNGAVTIIEYVSE